MDINTTEALKKLNELINLLSKEHDLPQDLKMTFIDIKEYIIKKD